MARKSSNGASAAEAEPTKKERQTIYIDTDVLERAKNFVVATRGMTLARFAENAFRRELERAEKANGGPFPPRSEPLQVGRPLK